MKRNLVLLIFIFSFSSTYCQKDISLRRIKKDSIYSIVDSEPKFLAGGIYLWLGQHISYPENSVTKGISGIVFVSFVVEKDGSVSTVKLLRGVDSGLNREVLKAIPQMPAWKAGKIGDEDVRVKMMLPVKFELLDHSDSNKIYTIVQQKPVFPKNMDSWIATHINYPKDADDDNIQGTVYISIVIERDGQVTDVEVLKQVDPDLDKEAMRIISGMPKWIPGTLDNHPVRVRYLIPVNFVINYDPTRVKMN